MSDIDLAFLGADSLSSIAAWDIAQELANSLNRDIDLVKST
jgi:predicted nucleotidyltransferase